MVPLVGASTAAITARDRNPGVSREAFGEGDWPAIIDRGTWAEVQDRSAYRASAHAYRSSRFYVLRGLVVCKKCGTHMSRSRGRAPSYLCTRRNELGPTRCTRRIHATMLKAFVTDAAVQLLTHFDVTGAPTAATALSAEDETAIAANERELAELKDMWTHRELLPGNIGRCARPSRTGSPYCNARPSCAPPSRS